MILKGHSMGANREYKNTVFTTLFDDADKLLELYSALSGGDYGPDTAIEINTLDDVLFMNMMNDISFTVGDRMRFRKRLSIRKSLAGLT